MSMVWLVIGLAALAAAWRLLRRSGPRSRAPRARAAPSSPPPRPVPVTGPILLAGNRPAFSFEIVGESHYQDALEAACGGRSDVSAEHVCEAELRAEPDNPHDANAVGVYIGDAKVGYLPARLAKEFHGHVERSGMAGRTLVCRAMVVGGWERGARGRGTFGAKLDLSWPPRPKRAR